MNKKLAIRTAIGLGAILAMFLGYAWFSNYSLDPEFNKKYQTAGYVAALETTEQGTKAVLFNPGGEKIDSAGYVEGRIDQELEWAPDGNHIFLSSNREGNTFGIYRWSPITNYVEKRSLGEQSQSALNFARESFVDPQQMGLLISGGKVFEYLPQLKQVNQKLSAVFDMRNSDSRNEEGAAIQSPGTGFKRAYWTRNRQAYYTIMSQEDGTEALVVYYVTDDAKGKPRPPHPMFVGDRIQIQISESGDAVVVVQNFRFKGQGWQTPDPTDEVRVAVENKNLLAYIALDDNLVPSFQPIVILPTPAQLLWDVSLSPNGEEFVVVVGELKNKLDFHPQGVLISPMKPTTPESPLSLNPVIQGPFTRPQWSPDGTKFVMLRDEPDGKRSVVTVNKDGSDITRLSPDGFDYEFAAFSPQVPAE
jgi:hypothetical protein